MRDEKGITLNIGMADKPDFIQADSKTAMLPVEKASNDQGPRSTGG